MSQKNRTGGGTPKLPPPKQKAPKQKAKPKPAPSRVARVRSTSRGGRGR